VLRTASSEASCLGDTPRRECKNRFSAPTPSTGLLLIVYMAAGLLGAYQYFRAHRQVSPEAHRSEPRRNAPKVGMTEPENPQKQNRGFSGSLESAKNKGALSTFPPPRLRLLDWFRI
jgi:hypothetical protein